MSKTKWICFVLSSVVVLGKEVVAELTCPPGRFFDVLSDGCHPCTLCDDPASALKVPGCDECPRTETDVTPGTPSCNDDMYYNLRMKECIHCVTCQGISDDQKKTIGCDQCISNSAEVPDPVDVDQQPKEEHEMKVHSPITDQLNSTSFILMVAGIALGIVLLVVSFVSVAFIVYRRRYKMAALKEFQTPLTMPPGTKGSTPATSMGTVAEVVMVSPTSTKITTRITPAHMPSVITIDEHKRAMPNRQTHVTVKDTCCVGTRSDKYEIMENNKPQCAKYTENFD